MMIIYSFINCHFGASGDHHSGFGNGHSSIKCACLSLFLFLGVNSKGEEGINTLIKGGHVCVRIRLTDLGMVVVDVGD